jgi:hypothetical protein
MLERMITTTHFDVQISNTYSGWAAICLNGYRCRAGRGGSALPDGGGDTYQSDLLSAACAIVGQIEKELLLSDEASQFGER